MLRSAVPAAAVDRLHPARTQCVHRGKGLHDRRRDGRVRLRQDDGRRGAGRGVSAGRSSTPTTSIRRPTSRRWPPARRSPTPTAGPGSTASPPRWRAIERARRPRGARVLGAEAGLPRPPRARRRRPLRAPRGRPGDHRAARSRRGPAHYMPASLLASQFATLEPPADAIVVDIRAAGRRAGRRRSAAASHREPTTPMSDQRQAPSAGDARRHLGRDPRRYLGAVNTPVFRASTILFPTVADLEAVGARRARRASATACTACRRSPTCRPRSPSSKAATRRSRCPPGSPRRRCRCSRCSKPGDHVLVTDSVYGPTRRFCDLHLTRLGVEVDLLRSARRRGDRARVAAEHARRVHRVAGIADLRGAGHPGDRRGRARARREGRAGQHLGDAALLPRRSTTASTSRCTRRPSTSAGTRTCCSA